jgi:hypothetical protein
LFTRARKRHDASACMLARHQARRLSRERVYAHPTVPFTRQSTHPVRKLIVIQKSSVSLRSTCSRPQNMIHVRTRHPSLGHGSDRGGSLGLLAREAEDETDSDPFTELPVMLCQGSGSAPGRRLAVKSWAPAQQPNSKKPELISGGPTGTSSTKLLRD